MIDNEIPIKISNILVIDRGEYPNNTKKHVHQNQLSNRIVGLGRIMLFSCKIGQNSDEITSHKTSIKVSKVITIEFPPLRKHT